MAVASAPRPCRISLKVGRKSCPVPEAEWRAMLSLLARLNACPVTPDYAPHLHPFEQGGKVDGWWITGFTNATPTDEEIAAIERSFAAMGVVPPWRPYQDSGAMADQRAVS